MSLILSSPVAPQASTAPATSQTGRSDSQSQNDADSFGAVLRRSQTGTEKTPEKAPEKTAVQRNPRNQNSSEKIEQPDPASALALAFIALEPRLAAIPANAAPTDPAGAVAAALGTDANLSAAPFAPATLGQNTQEQLVSQIALAASGPDIAKALTKEQQAAMAPAAGLTTPEQQDGDAPVLLTNATAETLPRDAQGAQQIALAAASQREPAQALLPAKSAATVNSTAAVPGTGEAGKITDQPITLDSRLTGQQSKQDETGTDSREGKFSAKVDLRQTEAPVSASIADAATKGNTTPVDQFSSSNAALANPVAMLQPTATGITQQAAAAPVSLPLTPPVGSNEWGDALGKQVVWMGNANHQVAELQLNPAGLGPLKITLTINNHQAEALFVSAHPAVRAAVEAALPQLRTNLADNGISLGNTSVNADTQQQSAFAQDQASQSSQSKYRTESASMLNPISDLNLPDAAPARAGKRSNVDLFA
jgi:flagellar hook-length control protein FliK